MLQSERCAKGRLKHETRCERSGMRSIPYGKCCQRCDTISRHIYSLLILYLQMIEKTKESQTQSLAELQQELKSLKALLLSRGQTMSNIPSSPLPSIMGRPTIPAWQLASASPTTVGGGSSSSEGSTPAFGSPVAVNGKGKEVEIPPPNANP